MRTCHFVGFVMRRLIRVLLKLAQVRWTGHVTRMSDERLPMLNLRSASAPKVARRNVIRECVKLAWNSQLGIRVWRVSTTVRVRVRVWVIFFVC